MFYLGKNSKRKKKSSKTLRRQNFWRSQSRFASLQEVAFWQNIFKKSKLNQRKYGGKKNLKRKGGIVHLTILKIQSVYNVSNSLIETDLYVRGEDDLLRGLRPSYNCMNTVLL